MFKNITIYLTGALVVLSLTFAGCTQKKEEAVEAEMEKSEEMGESMEPEMEKSEGMGESMQHEEGEEMGCEMEKGEEPGS